jgi:predicted small integral membrane protein
MTEDNYGMFTAFWLRILKSKWKGVEEDVSILIYTKKALKFVSQKSDLKI